MKTTHERKAQRLTAALKRMQHADEQRRATLSRYRLRRCYVTGDRYVKAVLEHRLDDGRRVWRLHAQIEGLTETELQAFARATGIALLDSGRKIEKDIWPPFVPISKPRKVLTSSEPPRGDLPPQRIMILATLLGNSRSEQVTQGELLVAARAALGQLTDPELREARKRSGTSEGVLADYNSTVLRRVIACALAVAKEA